MSAHAVLSPLANLDTRRGELDQPFEHLRRRTSTSFDVPKLFPHFVRFPIISSVEELDTTQEPSRP
jgi:hypothetical protein